MSRDESCNTAVSTHTAAAAGGGSNSSGAAAGAVIITVDVCLNHHWTDLVCGVDDTQMKESVEQLKDKFMKQTVHTVK